MTGAPRRAHPCPDAVPYLLLTAAPAAAVLLVAALAALAIARTAGPPAAAGRLVSLDGLRGYLALGVYVHHAMLWRHYLVRGAWGHRPGDPRLYRHLGDDAVTLFFMMTGFLFAAKLAEGRARPIDWPRLYVSRVLRIQPLYAAVLAATLAIVAARSGFALQESPRDLARNLLSWARFGNWAINRLPDTWMITAGVQWSLAYEWLFYAALPLAGLLFGVVAPARWLVASAVGTALWVSWIPAFEAIHVGAFGAGVLASVVTRSAAVRAALGGRGGALAAVAAAATAVAAFEGGHRWPVLLLLAVTFTAVASGNTLFGLLGWAPSRVLGEISYSIYLLHGLLLYVVLRGVVGAAAAGAMSAAAYWGLIVALAPVLVLGAFATFRLVERPAIGATPRAQRWVRRRLEQSRARRRAAAPAGPPPRPTAGEPRPVASESG